MGGWVCHLKQREDGRGNHLTKAFAHGHRLQEKKKKNETNY